MNTRGQEALSDESATGVNVRGSCPEARRSNPDHEFGLALQCSATSVSMSSALASTPSPATSA